METPQRFGSWFIRDTNWSRSGLPVAAFLLALIPVIRRRLGPGLLLVYLQLPVYMLHQFEEHANGAFKAYAHRTVLRGRAPVPDRTIFVINMGGVWVMDLALLYLARFRSLRYGLIACYLALVNGFTHIAMALKRREYNPGLATSLALFFPVGIYSVRRLSTLAPTQPSDHRRALAFSLLLHAAVFALMFRDTQCKDGRPPEQT